MIRSMTGHGASACEHEGMHIAVEVRSVNNRSFKAMLRLPDSLTSLEGELESRLARRVQRGSVSLTVRIGDTSARGAGRINTTALRNYLDQLKAVQQADTPIDPGALLSLPGVIMDDGGTALCEVARPAIDRLLEEACRQLFIMRESEGAALRSLLLSLGQTIQARLDEVCARAPEVSRLYGERLQARMTAMLSEAGVAARQEDVLREVATFAERADIAEEIQRLGVICSPSANCSTRRTPSPWGARSTSWRRKCCARPTPSRARRATSRSPRVWWT